ncbi:MAG: efflux RND transporter permease subunit [Elusimicrobiota bacterium]|jgi:multidrug efflux pump subunit AcrB
MKEQLGSSANPSKDMPPQGLAGTLASTFIRSKLTVLLVVSSLLMGVFATLKLPREEEPQINVPMFDLFVPFPGASAKEVSERVTSVGERKLWEIPGVEYIYSTSEPGAAMFIVRFKVGTDPGQAMTLLHAKTSANLDILAPGAGRPLIKPRSIDDVPILALTLSGKGQDAYALRRAAAALREEISGVADVSEIAIIGGRKRTLLVHFDPRRLSERRIDPLELAGMLQSSNRKLPAGHYDAGDKSVQVETDAFIRSAEDLRGVVVGVSAGRPVKLSDVARIIDGPDDSEQEVFALAGAGEPGLGPSPAVTLAVSKRRGANATVVSREVLARVRDAKGRLLAPGMDVQVTRDYGRTAKEKSDELIFHMLLATLSVTLLIALALGVREALVVLVAVPVTLSLTLLVYFLFGYTLNRITLFALIFSIGILVDDAIVVVENIHRHYMMKDGREIKRLAVDAVAEVGNPTILATWAVVAAILPMAFVRGLMGPYMRPIPVGASFAMLFSLAIAFIVSPWAFTRLLEIWKPKDCGAHAGESFLDRLYRRFMGRLLSDVKARGLYLAAMAVLLLGSMSLVYFKLVTVKMLPFDNKDEFEVIVDMPEDSSLARTRAASLEMAESLRKIPEVEFVTSYVGTAAPYNFNGLVRHYFLRQRPYQAGLLVNLSGRHERKRQSHAIASQARGPVQEIARKYGARVQIAEVPPGPPVLSTLVLELYDQDDARRDAMARKVRELLERTPGIVDVGTYVPEAQPMDRLEVDRPKATLNAISSERVAQVVSLAMSGQDVDLAHMEDENEPVDIRLRLAPEDRKGLDAVRSIRLFSRAGSPVAIKELTRVRRTTQEPPIFRKNLRKVSYVVADVAGRQESPVYGILALRPELRKLLDSSGAEYREYFSSQPRSSLETAVKWDGEWQITYEVFRDLGLAFAVVLVLIYILVVGWFKSFSVPLVIMAPIPLTLVGILPAHWALGAFFTATSMIGFIAGAGIVVRNSIILVDFIELRMREGMALKDAVIDAGAVRFKPMLLTAAAVVVGAGVILFDPIFQGLAVALMAGEVASTLLSRMAVPILYFMLKK